MRGWPAPTPMLRDITLLHARCTGAQLQVSTPRGFVSNENDYVLPVISKLASRPPQQYNQDAVLHMGPLLCFPRVLPDSSLGGALIIH